MMRPTNFQPCGRGLIHFKGKPTHAQLRSFFASSSALVDAEQLSRNADQATSDPVTLSTQRAPSRGSTTKLHGSRRSRAVLSQGPNIPFEQLPYQCFQEARKFLQADRQEKIEQIRVMRGRITRLLEQDPAISGGQEARNLRLLSSRTFLENLKILADINDPAVKKRFEDGNGTSTSVCKFSVGLC